MFFLLLGLSTCLISKALLEHPHKELRMLHEGTVVLITYAYVAVDGYTADSDEGVAHLGYQCKLCVRGHKNWADVEKAGRIVANYNSEDAKESSFIFVAPRTEHYLFSLYDKNSRADKALEVHFYEGRKKDPRIFSSADSHARDIQGKIQSAIEYCNSINDIQRFDSVEEDEFKRCYKAMERIVFYSVLFKIVTAASTFFFFNRKIKNFYLSKKILRE